ncbi:MAG TPA: serine/threonine-protein kinase [Polyangia bacterium]|nr:serine/threonine-protein kinase [Polyangia bacterium]
MMAVCSRCHKDWPEQYWVCPEDGTVLTAARTATGQVITTPIGIPREEDLRAGTMIGEYRVEGKLGEGGMATVFAATHPLIGKKDAIKVISRRLCSDLHAVERFINEARTVNQIGHPNLVDIFAFGVLPDGRAYLVMEWLQGETLAERLARERMPVPRALDVLTQIVDALEAAHEKGIIHRDLKPQNIFVVERNEKTSVKLLDFGIAKLADSDASVPKTRSGVAMGTAGYMSPEQARGKNVDHRTDIYALGCLAYEMLLGRLPFVADTAIDILAMHLAAAPPAPRTLWAGMPAGLEKILLQALSKEPDGRPSLMQVRAVLESALRTITPNMGIASAPRAHVERAGTATWLIAGGVAVVVVAAGVYGYVTTRAREAVAPALVPPAAVAPTTAPAPSLPSAPVPSSPAPAAKNSTLVVYAPTGAHVAVDGAEYLSRGAPLRVDVVGGEHRVVVAAAHKLAWSGNVRVADGASADVHPSLSRTRGNNRPATTIAPSAAEGDKRAPDAEVTPEAKAAPDVKSEPKPDGTKEPKKSGGDYTLDPF